MTDHQAEMEFEDDSKNIRISGLKFYTKGDGQKTMAQLAEITQVQEVSVSSSAQEICQMYTDCYSPKNTSMFLEPLI